MQNSSEETRERSRVLAEQVRHLALVSGPTLLREGALRCLPRCFGLSSTGMLVHLERSRSLQDNEQNTGACCITWTPGRGEAARGSVQFFGTVRQRPLTPPHTSSPSPLAHSPITHPPNKLEQVGAYHLDVKIDTVVSAMVSLFQVITGKIPRFRVRLLPKSTCCAGWSAKSSFCAGWGASGCMQKKVAGLIP